MYQRFTTLLLTICHMLLTIRHMTNLDMLSVRIHNIFFHTISGVFDLQIFTIQYTLSERDEKHYTMFLAYIGRYAKGLYITFVMLL